MTLRRITLDAPYLLFMGDVGDAAELIAAAEEGNARLIDARVPPSGLPVGSGVERSGKRVLTVGTGMAPIADFLQEKC